LSDCHSTGRSKVWPVKVQSATEVEVLDEVSQGYPVGSDVKRKTQLRKI